jgi:ketosteroid isomerase-like protein
MSTEDEVRQASDRFYAALNRMLNGDAGPMMEVWSHSSDVTTMHPIGGREVGWEQVRVPWEQVAAICSGGQGTLRDPLIRVVGDLAYQVGTEMGGVLSLDSKSLLMNASPTSIAVKRESGR